MGNERNLYFGDLTLDEPCLSAYRDGRTIQFTRNERALLLAFTRNPQRLMRRNRLLDAIDSSEIDRSDRYVDFLVNRLRTKLGDSKTAPRYIATQYGEGYVWIATPASALPMDAFLAIAGSFGLLERAFRAQASSLLGQIRDLTAASVGGGGKILVVEENWQPGAADKLRYFLQVSFRTDIARLACTATLREMPSKRIVKAFRLHLDRADTASFANEAERVSNGVADVSRQALAAAAMGLGVPTEEPLEIRLHKAAALLSASNPQWFASGEQLGRKREQDPLDLDTALQWCMHLFGRLTVTSPFGGMSVEERDRIETEIEVTVLELLPAVEANPLLMLTCAKLLYFIDRGHLELAEDITARACARIGDYAAALPLTGQLHYARGRFDEAVEIFDRGIAMAEAGPAFHIHLRVLRCLALLAAGNRAALDAAIDDLTVCIGPFCPPDLATTIEWTLTPADRELPEASAQALAAIGPTGARSAIEYLYFTSARQLVSKRARANVMRGLSARAIRLHGEHIIPSFVLKSIGSIATD